jgi:serine/threonine protein kinase
MRKQSEKAGLPLPSTPISKTLARMDPLIGKNIFNSANAEEGYVIDSLQGRGGMGRVYLARTLAKNELRALKFAPTLDEISCTISNCDTKPEDKKSDIDKRFMQEAETLIKLNHPNIVRAYSCGGVKLEGGTEPVPGLIYMAMEYINGMSLAQLLEKGHVLWPVAQNIVLHVCDALTYAHERGIIHRDIKPGNIMLRETGDGKYDPLLIDFGSIRVPGTSVLTMDSDIIGTLHYMSPEQLNSSHNVGPASDIYGLGSVLYEVLAGKGNVPFDAEELGTLINAISKDKPVSPRKRAPDRRIPRRLNAIILKTLGKKPKRRYFDVRALGAAISSCKWKDRGPRKRNPFLRWAAIVGLTAITGTGLAFGPYAYMRMRHPPVHAAQAAPMPLAAPAEKLPDSLMHADTAKLDTIPAAQAAKHQDSVPRADTLVRDTGKSCIAPPDTHIAKKPAKTPKKMPSHPKKDANKNSDKGSWITPSNRYSTPKH